MRSASGVIFPAVAAEVSMSPSVVGLISGMLFFGYTAGQPYSGRLCDSKDPVFAVCLGLILFGLGLFTFSFTENPYIMGAARFFVGVGSAPTFCALMTFQANTFAPAFFARLTGITIVFGHFGGVVGITPLGFMMDLIGFRKLHLLLALISASIIMLLVLVAGKSILYKKTSVTKDKASLWAGFRIIFRSRRLTSLLSMWCLALILQLTLVGLWGVIWLTDTVTTITVNQARLSMTMGGMGLLAGAFLSGIYGNRLIRIPGFLQKLTALMTSSLALLTIAISYGCGWQIIAPITFFLGMMIGTTIVTSNVTLFNVVGTDVIGTVTGANNVLLFLSVLLSQWFSGLFIDFVGRYDLPFGLSQYSAFFSLLILYGAAVSLYLGKVDFGND